MKNPNKANETMSIDSAVWYIEAALNYTHCNAEVSEIVGVDSVFVTINVSDNGEIDFYDITSAYDQLETDMVTALGENTMRLADVEFVENSNKTEEKTFKLTVLKAPGGGPTPPNYIGSFGNTDYWEPVFENGKCDIYLGQGIGNDASSMIEKKINLLRIELPYGYVTDVETIYVGAYDYYSGWEGYFWEGSPDNCLNPTEMNYWLSKGKEIAEIKKPTGKQLISSDYFYDSPYSGTWYHMAYFNYGIWHTKSPADEIR